MRGDTVVNRCSRVLFLVLCLGLGLAGSNAAIAQIEQAESMTGVSPAYERRAIDVALWGMPIVSFDAMREAYFRDAGAAYNDLVFWSRPSDHFNQTTTPNSTSHYVYANINLAAGPVVFELPATGRTSLYGNVHSAWQVPVEDFGPAGIDRGQGGRFLFTPLGYSGDVPPGMQQIALPTRNAFMLLRVSSNSTDRNAADHANALIHNLRLYSLSEASAPRPQRLIDMSGRLFDAIVQMNASFYERLARILAEEDPDRRDMVMLGMAATLGIERGQPFLPSAQQRMVLAGAAAQAKAEMIDMVLTRRNAWWPGSRWGTSAGLIQIATDGFTYEQTGALRLDERARTFFYAFAMPRRLGAATFYLTQVIDRGGAVLDGSKTYTLHIPPKVPAKDYWAVNAYDLETSGFLRGAEIVGVDSNRRDLIVNADGSVDVVFSATRPKGKGNWVSLVPGKRWTAMFRFYGPQPALFDKSWRLPDIELVKPYAVKGQ